MSATESSSHSQNLTLLQKCVEVVQGFATDLLVLGRTFDAMVNPAQTSGSHRATKVISLKAAIQVVACHRA